MLSGLKDVRASELIGLSSRIMIAMAAGIIAAAVAIAVGGLLVATAAEEAIGMWEEGR